MSDTVKSIYTFLDIVSGKIEEDHGMTPEEEQEIMESEVNRDNPLTYKRGTTKE